MDFPVPALNVLDSSYLKRDVKPVNRVGTVSAHKLFPAEVGKNTMAKIGRNEKCPCGSGKKFKHCCARNPKVEQRPATPEEQLKVSLMGAVKRVCGMAAAHKPVVMELGVFILCATKTGDVWLFEVTQSDRVKLMDKTELLPSPISENPETIEIEWSHTFEVVNKDLILTDYKDKSTMTPAGVPVMEISASKRRIIKKIPEDMLDKIHVSPEKID